jgi:hypothetical protein
VGHSNETVAFGRLYCMSWCQIQNLGLNPGVFRLTHTSPVRRVVSRAVVIWGSAILYRHSPAAIEPSARINPCAEICTSLHQSTMQRSQPDHNFLWKCTRLLAFQVLGHFRHHNTRSLGGGDTRVQNDLALLHCHRAPVMNHN